MKNAIFYFIALIVIVGGAYWYGTCNREPAEAEVVIETEYIKGDTVTIYKDRFFSVTKIDTVTITEEGDTIKTHFDSTFVYEGDTVLTINADVSIADMIAEWFVGIDYRQVEKIATDSVKTTTTKYPEETFFDKVKDVTFIIILVEIALAVLIFLTGGL